MCLSGRAVDEDNDYSRERDVDGLIRPAAQTLFNWSRHHRELPNHCVPSLSAAILEVRRLG
jgi:hypothetical protein